MSIVSAYETYRDRVFRTLNVFFPVNEAVDILAGNDPASNPYDALLLDRQRKLDAALPEPLGDFFDEEEDDESGDG